MNTLKNLLLVAALYAIAIGTANAATAENSSNSAAADIQMGMGIPLPSAPNFVSYVDFYGFSKACAKLNPVALILKKNGENISLICQSEDGGNVGVAANENDAVVSIHQTKQMNGKAITRLNRSFTIAIPVSFISDDKCAEKVKEATEAQDSGIFGDVQIKFNSHSLDVTCQDTSAQSISPIQNSLKALGNFLTGHQ